MQSIFRRLDRIPLWLRPSAIGVAFVLMFAVSRGALIVIPLLIIGVLIWSPTPLFHIGSATALYLVVLIGAALGGLSYQFIGRHLRRVPYLGTFLAAYVTVVPYVYALLPLGRLKYSEPQFALPDYGEHAVVWGVAAFFGAALAYGWHLESKKPADEQDAA